MLLCVVLCVLWFYAASLLFLVKFCKLLRMDNIMESFHATNNTLCFSCKHIFSCMLTMAKTLGAVVGISPLMAGRKPGFEFWIGYFLDRPQ